MYVLIHPVKSERLWFLGCHRVPLFSLQNSFNADCLKQSNSFAILRHRASVRNHVVMSLLLEEPEESVSASGAFRGGRGDPESLEMVGAKWTNDLLQQRRAFLISVCKKGSSNEPKFTGW